MGERFYKLNPYEPMRALETEWLLSNGLGGFAMGTAAGANTRRYHGLLVAAFHPPVDRVIALHSIVDQVIIRDTIVDLGTHQFGPEAALHPDGWRRLVQFSYHWPLSYRWTYRIGRLVVRQTLELHWHANQCDIRYEFDGVHVPMIFRMRPLTPLRSFHDLGHAHESPPQSRIVNDRSIEVSRDGRLLWLSVESGPGGAWRLTDHWNQFAYVEERARGQDWMEDVWSPGDFEVPLSVGGPHAWTFRFSCPGVFETGDSEFNLTAEIDTPRGCLEDAADQFIVVRETSHGPKTTILAGYPWFADWGRDAMISLPGLLLCTKRFSEARSVLESFAGAMQQGLIPNQFHDQDEANYHTVDASLWFVHAVREYRLASGDDQIGDLMASCRTIIDAYMQGTSFDIRQDTDGLIMAGRDGEAPLTWMDARRDGIVYTPRVGKPVEINALWYNALRALAEMTADPAEIGRLGDAAEHTAASFRKMFCRDERQGLVDVLTTSGRSWVPDRSVRPNQIFAVSLPFSPLTPEQQRHVVQVVTDRLLTPFGLRTLAPDDPGYIGRYEGDLTRRDAAYHNGTVWPWLLGPYGEALLRVRGDTPETREHVRTLLRPLVDTLNHGCLGQLAEVYDGDEPHRASGCPAQAWSVAEVLRLLTLIASK